MSKAYCYSLPNGRAAVIRVHPNLSGDLIDLALQKATFEATRPRTPEGLAEHFDPNNPAHLARGNTLPLFEVDEADFPLLVDKRNDWVLESEAGRNVVRASRTPLPPLPDRAKDK